MTDNESNLEIFTKYYTFLEPFFIGFISDAVVMLEIDKFSKFKIKYLSDSFFSRLNHEPKDLSDASALLDYIVPEDKDKMRKAALEYTQPNSNFEHIYRVIEKNDSIGYRNVKGVFFPSVDDKTVIYLVLAISNVTKYMLQRFELNDSKHFLSLIDKELAILKLKVDNTDDALVEANSRFFNMVGYDDIDDYRANSPAKLPRIIHPDYSEAFFNNIKEAARNKTPFQMEVKALKKGHDSIWIQVWGQANDGTDPNIVSLCILDITLTREAHEELNNFVKCLNGGFAIAEIGEDNLPDFTFISDRLCQILDDTKENLKIIYSNIYLKAIHPQDRNSVKSWLVSNKNGKATGPQYFRLSNSRGEFFWVSGNCLFKTENNRTKMYLSFIDISQLKKTESENLVNAAAFRIAAQQSGKSIARYDIKTKTLYQQPDFMTDFQLLLTVENVPEASVKNGLVAPESVNDYYAFYNDMANGISGGKTTLLMKNLHTGQYEWYKGAYTLIFDSNHQPEHAVITYTNINRASNSAPQSLESKASATGRKTMLIVDDEKASRERLKAIFSDEYTIIEAENGEIAENILAKRGDEIAVMMLNIFMPVRDGLTVLRNMQGYESRLTHLAIIAIDDRDEEEFEFEAIKYGAADFLSKSATANLIRFRVNAAIQKTTATRIYYENVLLNAQREEEARYQREITDLANYDHLTGLLNRTAFLQITAQILDTAKANEYMIAVIDIDNFKIINDLYGHNSGDKILQTVASAIKQISATTQGICCHLMADLFALFIKYTDENLKIISHINDTLCNYPIQYDLSIRTGKFIINDIDLPVSAMLDRAVLACRSIKGQRYKTSVFYTEQMMADILEEQEIVNDAEKALINNEFLVYFQPKFSLSDKKVIGAEALVRWQHPTRGLLTPSSFIPAFERNGLILKLDEYVWNRTAKFLRKWLDEGKKVVPISINVSRVNIYNPNLIKTLTGIVKKYDLPQGLLELEITESAFIGAQAQANAVIMELRKCGFIVDMDDFGSGYSSLSALRDIELDTLKLDIRFLPTNQNDIRGMSILNAVVNLAKQLKLGLIAEGVETLTQVEYLQKIGCDAAQGYYFSRPVSSSAFESFIN